MRPHKINNEKEEKNIHSRSKNVIYSRTINDSNHSYIQLMKAKEKTKKNLNKTIDGYDRPCADGDIVKKLTIKLNKLNKNFNRNYF